MTEGFRQFPAVPSLRDVYEVGNGIMQGRLNDKESVTLTANQASTVVIDYRVSAQSVITFMPLTSNAAAELATMYVSARANGTFTITHANNAQTDRSFGYRISA